MVERGTVSGSVLNIIMKTVQMGHCVRDRSSQVDAEGSLLH
jgi:hypothetical protein